MSAKDASDINNSLSLRVWASALWRSTKAGLWRALMLFLGACFAIAALAQTEVEGDVSGVWNTDGSPYILIGDATVPDDDSLTIDPGVEVRFGEGLTLTVNGCITATGTEEDTIRFLGAGGDRGGTFYIRSAQDTIRISYCRFDSLGYGIYAWETPISIAHSLFYNCDWTMRLGCRWVEVKNNTIVADSLGFCKTRVGEAVVYPQTVRFEGNHCRTQGDLTIFYTDDCFINDNIIEPLIPNGYEYYMGVSLLYCRRITCRNNKNIDVFAENSGQRLESAIIEDNTMRSVGIMNSMDSVVTIAHNVIANVIVLNDASADIRDNTVAGISLEGTSTALAEHNLITWPYGSIAVRLEGNCQLELNHNTIIKDEGDRDSPIIGWDVDEPDGSRLTLRNNILMSFVPTNYAIHPDIGIASGGYNCFWGVDTAYCGNNRLREGDIMEDPQFIGGHPYEYQLQANSPSINAGDPDLPEDPDSTRADIGCYFYDQANGMPPAIISRHDAYTSWGMEFRYAARATDMSGAIVFEFTGLPEWLQVEDDGRRDFVSDSAVVSGVVPQDQEDFVFMVTARDDGGLEDTLSVQAFVYPFTVLTGKIGGVLTREHSPYLVADTAWVAADDSLIIEPGCRVYVKYVSGEDGHYSKIQADGFIRAIGTINDSITFTNLDPNLVVHIIIAQGPEEGHSEFRFCHFNGAGMAALNHGCIVSNCTVDSNAYISLDGVNSDFIFSENNINGRGLSLRGNGSISNNRFFTWDSIETAISAQGDSLTISGNFITGFSVGIHVHSTRNGVISHNKIVDGPEGGSSGIKINHLEANYPYNRYLITLNEINNHGGISSGSSVPTLRIANNLITNSGGITSWSDTTWVFNNIVYRSRKRAYLQVWDPKIAVISNNLFIEDSILFGTYESEPDNISFIYNACFGNDTLLDDLGYIGDIIRTNTNGDSCDAGFNIFLDPQIVSSGSLDFHLYAGSPLINAGNPDSSFNDLDGTVNDIGLYGGPFGESYEYPQGVGLNDAPIPEGFALERPQPNPFNTMTLFAFPIPTAGDLEVKAYDVTGRMVFDDRLGSVSAGSHRYVWRGQDRQGRPLPTGIYYFELTWQNSRLVRQVVLLK